MTERYTLPASDAPAEEWGRVAVSLPGWEWMPGMRSEIHTDTRRAAYRWLAGPSDDRHYGHVVIVEDKRGHACRTLATLQPGPDDVPDPDDPATEGCLLRLLQMNPVDGSMCHVLPPSSAMNKWRVYLKTSRGNVTGYGSSLGRACIAAAAEIGEWPGGAA